MEQDQMSGPTPQKRFNLWLIATIVLAVFLIAGGIIFAWQKSASDKVKNDLQGQINTLQSQVQQLTATDTGTACLKEGEINSTGYNSSEKSLDCCPGLKVIPVVDAWRNPDGSVDTTCSEGKLGVPYNVVCTYCGNGVCGTGENKCNCSADCKDSVDATADWKTYTNAKYGYEVKYPNDWTTTSNSALLDIKKTDTTQPKMLLTPGDPPLEYPYYEIQVSAGPIETPNAKKLEDLTFTCIQDTIIDHETIDGEQAIRCTSGAAPGGYFDVIFIHNNFLYKLKYTYNSDAATKYKFEPTVDTMLSTFKFTK